MATKLSRIEVRISAYRRLQLIAERDKDLVEYRKQQQAIDELLEEWNKVAKQS